MKIEHDKISTKSNLEASEKPCQDVGVGNADLRVLGNSEVFRYAILNAWTRINFLK
jgi:hypothetical protein